MTKKIEPLGNRLLVQVLDAESTTPSGIVLPETAQEKPIEGLVEAIGDKEEFLSNLDVGDKVLFAKYSGTEIKLNSRPYLILTEDDVLARVLEG